MDRRLQAAGAELVKVKDTKLAQFLRLVRIALAGPTDAASTLREFLRYEATQHRLMLQLLKQLEQKEQPATQLTLPWASPKPRIARKHETLGAQLAATTDRKAGTIAKLLEGARTEEAAAVFREYVRWDTKQHRLSKKILNMMTPRVENSMPRHVLDLLDSKPDKVWPRSVILARMVEAFGKQVAENDGTVVDQALRKLLQDGFAQQPGRGLYQSARGA